MKNVCILLLVFQVLSFNDAYNFSCPSNAQWAIRAKSTCTPPKEYTCLYNVTFQVNVYTDRCIEPRIISPGYKYVFQPNPNNATCTKTRYQPFIFDTIGYSDCAILKSLCNSKGQTTYRNGNSTSDRTCSCNTDQGYTFVVNSMDQCFCNPSTEDCSCYIGINPKNKTTGLKDPKCNGEPNFTPKLSRGDLLNQYQALKIDDFDNYKYNIALPSNANRNTAAVIILMIFFLYIGFLVAIEIYIRRRMEVRHQFNVLSQEYGKLINEQKLEKRYFVKIMIVGREHAGKTSLMRRLLKERFNENEQSTDGVDIVTRRCKINIKNGQWEIGKDVIDDKLDRMRRAQNRITDMSSDATVPTTKNGRKDININNFIVMETEHLNNENLDTITYTEDGSEMIQQQSLVHHENTGSSHSSVDKKEYQDESAYNIKQIIKNDEGPYLHNLEGEASNILDDLVSSIDFEKPSGDYALCGLWDFAGQKEFYATHQVFLTSCAVYLLVVDIDDDVKQSTNQYFSDLKDVGEHVDFWFDSIHCLRNDDIHAQTSEDYHIDPPVIIVCTGIDKHTTQIDERKELFLSRLNDVMGNKSKFHHYRDTFFVSNKEDVDDVFQKIRLEISETAKDLSNWAEKKPLQWILMEHLLEKIKSRGIVIVTYEQIYSLSSRKEFGIRNKPALNEFLAFQHNIGNIIFFENIDEYVILNPQWLADAFRCLVSDKIEPKIINHPDFKVLRETGTLSPRLISDFFLSKPRSQFLKYKDHILKVMEKFDIIVRPKEVNFSEKEGCYILPYIMQGSTLKKVCELFKIDRNNCTRTSWLCIEFDFLPPSFFYHVLAWYIRKYELSNLFRGIGVFDLEGSGCQQLVITTSENTVAIQIWNRGHGTEVTTDCIKIREEFYSKIRNLQQRRMRLTYHKKITCSNGDICKSSVRVEKLQRAEFYRCPEHNTHSSHDVLSPWFKNVSQDIKIPTDIGNLNMVLGEQFARNTNGGRTQKHLEVFFQHEITECSDGEGETIKSPSLTHAERHHTLLNFKPEDRLIPPLRDKMIYDLATSLDFKDEVADIFYSQYEDFDKSSDSDEEFCEFLKDILDKEEDEESTLTFQEDHEAGALGPVVREQKIKNLRAECQKYLGEEAFEKAYNYLKKARYENQEDIMQGLRKFVKNPSDFLLVDQLLFLEERAKISKG